VTHQLAKPCLAIKIVTGFIFLMTLGFFVGALSRPELWLAAWLSALIILICYLTTPSSIELSRGRLVVHFGLWSTDYGRIVGCCPLTEKLPMTFRLFGNGGVFAGTGIFWNKKYGKFRAYITATGHSSMVMLTTDKYRVLISPAHVEKFILAAGGERWQ